jgi:hypothetical protein
MMGTEQENLKIPNLLEHSRNHSYEVLPASSEAWIYLAMIRRLARE